ncbi:hypothetical protein E1262_01275 [Jiangella aurantiaca]|uniref:Galactose oxidase n=1 Tax=Jiangella aurantiaca TaxID=2530373 RepID=A0A4R5ANC6_9ACTN|nr:hypothetical protein [Jiangella aurantiaca]TDD73139.1 hypothetical protein E1262_01275 [Jiangella aurantiaca]
MRGTRALGVAATGLTALLAAGCGETPAEPQSESTDDGGWTRVAESPLSPREAPLTVTVGEKILVIGGSDGPPCPPNASCVAPPEPLRDGAAYDPGADAWTPIADAPAPVGAGPDTSVVVGDTVYLLSTQWGTDGTGTTSFLAYDAAADAWTELTLPGDEAWLALTVAGGQVVAYRGSHEAAGTEVPTPLDPLPADLVYDPAADSWTELPADPLGPSYDRRLIGTDDGAVLLASALVPNPGVDPPVVNAARLDLATGTWTQLPDGDLISGYGFRRVGDQVVSAVEGSADGGETNNWGREIGYAGLLDPATGTWSELPERAERDPLDGFMIPGDVSGERTVVSGAWVLDVPTLSWSRVPALPVEDHIQGQSAAFAGTADGGVVFLWGGSRWPGRPDEPEATNEGELLAEGWVWRLPPPG